MKSLETSSPFLLAAILALSSAPLLSQQLGHKLILNREITARPVPVWDNGYILGFELEPGDAPPVYAFDSAGTKIFDTTLSMKGVSRIWINSVAGRQGSFAVSGRL